MAIGGRFGGVLKCALRNRNCLTAVFRNRVCQNILVRSSKRPTEAILLSVERRCLVCDFVQQQAEAEETDVIGPPCTRCRAPTERIAVLTRRIVAHEPNPHAAALGRLGGLKGGPARAAALSPKRRREIAKAAARARWRRAE